MTILAAADPWVPPIAGIVGIIVGALLTGGVAVWAERRRWAREDSVRLEAQQREDCIRDYAERRTACARLLQAVDETLTYGRPVLFGMLSEGRSEAADALFTFRSTRYAGAERASRDALGTLLLLGSPTLATAARELDICVQDELASVLEHQGMAEARARRVEAESAFLDTARSELGIDNTAAVPSLEAATKP